MLKNLKRNRKVQQLRQWLDRALGKLRDAIPAPQGELQPVRVKGKVRKR